MDYPYDNTSEIASVFKINQEDYNWQVTDFTNPEVEKTGYL